MTKQKAAVKKAKPATNTTSVETEKVADTDKKAAEVKKAAAKATKKAAAKTAAKAAKPASLLRRMGRRIRRIFSRRANVQAAAVKAYRTSARAARAVVNAVRAAFQAFLRGLKATYTLGANVTKATAGLFVRGFKAIGRAFRAIGHGISSASFKLMGATSVIYHKGIKAPVATVSNALRNFDLKKVGSYIWNVIWTAFWVTLSTSLIVMGGAYIGAGYAFLGVFCILVGLWGYTAEWVDFFSALMGKDVDAPLASWAHSFRVKARPDTLDEELQHTPRTPDVQGDDWVDGDSVLDIPGVPGLPDPSSA